MSGLSKNDYPVKWIAVKHLKVLFPEAQRPLNRAKVRRIVNEFDPAAFAPPVVMLPDDDGIYHIIDGQTGVEAVREYCGENEQVPCVVLPARTIREAAELFLLRNPGGGLRSPPTQIEGFRVAVTARRPMESEVDGLIRGLGWVVDTEIKEGTVRAIAACMRIRKKYGIVTLKCAMEAIKGTWGMDKDATHQAIIGGFGELFGRFKADVDRSRLIAKIERRYGKPGVLVGVARVRASGGVSGSIAEVLCGVLVELYNSGLRSNRLES